MTSVLSAPDGYRGGANGRHTPRSPSLLDRYGGVDEHACTSCGIAAVPLYTNVFCDAHLDALRCFSVVLPSGELPDGNSGYCCRTNTITAYLGANLDLISASNVAIHSANGSSESRELCTQGMSGTRFPNRRFKDCFVADECHVGANVSLKRSVIGPRCRIGDRAKLQNCVLMDNVSVGECAVIQNSILCSNVMVEDRCNLNDCQVGVGMTVSSGCKHKGETLVKAPLTGASYASY